MMMTAVLVLMVVAAWDVTVMGVMVAWVDGDLDAAESEDGCHGDGGSGLGAVPVMVWLESATRRSQ